MVAAFGLVCTFVRAGGVPGDYTSNPDCLCNGDFATTTHKGAVAPTLSEFVCDARHRRLIPGDVAFAHEVRHGGTVHCSQRLQISRCGRTGWIHLGAND